MPLIQKRNYLKNQVSLALGIEKGSLIDFETTGLLKDKEHEIVGFGYIVANRLIILGRRSKEKGPYYSEIRRVIKKLPKPFYAYNVGFERGILGIELGISSETSRFIDLQTPWRSEADAKGLKWPKLDELIPEQEEHFEGIRIGGKDIPGLWKAYLSSDSENLLRMIMQHNLADLLRETILLLLHPEIAREEK